MKTIKRRITSVETTRKIMKAMDMVSAAKLQKARARLAASRPFIDETRKLITGIDQSDEVMNNPYFKQRRVKHTAYVVITSDRGLCGTYNTNLTEKVLAHINDGKNEMIIAAGLKGYEYFKLRGKRILRMYPDVSETVFYHDAERIAGYLASLYTSGEADEVYIAYTQYESALTHTPRVLKILPLTHRPEAEPIHEMRYEPDVSTFLDQAIPMCLNAIVYTALIQSSTCEQAARMISMEAAVDNASDIIHKLTRTYNRKRQAAITQEISEIVGGADMLEMLK